MYFPESIPEGEIRAASASSAEEKESGNSESGSLKKELKSKSLCDLTLGDVLEIQRMNVMPLSLLEEYYIYMFNECSLTMKQRIDALNLARIDTCCSEFRDFDVL